MPIKTIVICAVLLSGITFTNAQTNYKTGSGRDYKTEKNQTKTDGTDGSYVKHQTYKNESYTPRPVNQEYYGSTNNSANYGKPNKNALQNQTSTKRQQNTYSYKTNYTLSQNGYTHKINTQSHIYNNTLHNQKYLTYYLPDLKITGGGYAVPENALLLNGKSKLKDKNGKVLEESYYKNGELISTRIKKESFSFTYRNNKAEVIDKNSGFSYSYLADFIPVGEDYTNNFIVVDSLGNTHHIIMRGCMMWNGNLQCFLEYENFVEKNNSNRICSSDKWLTDWEFKEYYPNGKIKTQGVLVMNPCTKTIVPVGIWKTYHVDGSILKENDFGLRALNMNQKHPLHKTELQIAAENKRMLFRLQNRYGILN